MSIVYLGAGAPEYATGDPANPAWPTHQAGDLGLLLVETANEPIATPSGWTQIGSTQGCGTAGGDGTALQVFYRIAIGSSEAAPNVPDSGNHTLCQVHAYRGVNASAVLDGGAAGGVTPDALQTTLTLSGVTTRTTNALAVFAVATSRDPTVSPKTNSFSGWSGSGLTLTERQDFAVGTGAGGGIGLADAPKATPGATGSVTVESLTQNWAAYLSFALRDAANGLAEPAGLIGSVGYGSATAAGGAIAYPSGFAGLVGRGTIVATGGASARPAGRAGSPGLGTVLATGSSTGNGKPVGQAGRAGLGTAVGSGGARVAPIGVSGGQGFGGATGHGTGAVSVSGFIGAAGIGTPGATGGARARPMGQGGTPGLGDIWAYSPHGGTAFPRGVDGMSELGSVGATGGGGAFPGGLAGDAGGGRPIAVTALAEYRGRRAANALAARLHSVFDTNPEASLALRVRSDHGLVWEISGFTLTLTIPSGSRRWALESYTVRELAQAIEAAGFDVPYVADDLASFNATALLEGAGDQDASNGDHILAMTAPLAVLLDGLGSGFDDAKAAIGQALAQLILPRSTAEWADLFGTVFGIPRWDGEADAVYTDRIAQEVQRHRSNPAAILRNIRRLTGERLAVREPWTEIHILSDGALSGAKHLQAGLYPAETWPARIPSGPVYELHTMQLVATRGPDWSRVLPEAEADRPAGTAMLPPATHPACFLVDDMAGATTPELANIRCWAEELRWNAYGRLSVDLALSDYMPPPFFEAARVDVRDYGTDGLRGPYSSTPELLGWTGEWDARSWISAAPVEGGLPEHWGEWEIYPPHDILASDYVGIFRMSESALSYADRLQYKTSEWTFAVLQLGAGALAGGVRIDSGRTRTRELPAYWNPAERLSVDGALSDTLRRTEYPWSMAINAIGTALIEFRTADGEEFASADGALFQLIAAGLNAEEPGTTPIEFRTADGETFASADGALFRLTGPG